MNARKWLRTEATRMEREAKAMEVGAKQLRDNARGFRSLAKDDDQRAVEDYVESLRRMPF